MVVDCAWCIVVDCVCLVDGACMVDGSWMVYGGIMVDCVWIVNDLWRWMVHGGGW